MDAWGQTDHCAKVTIDCSDGVPKSGKKARMATCAAGHIKNPPARNNRARKTLHPLRRRINRIVFGNIGREGWHHQIIADPRTLDGHRSRQPASSGINQVRSAIMGGMKCQTEN
jgi:hypothetical protein